MWFWRYLRALFGTFTGTLLLIAGFISTAMTFVVIYLPQYQLPRWLPIAIVLVDSLVGPSRLYYEMEKRATQLERDLTLERAAVFEEPQLSLSVLWPEDNPLKKPMQFVVNNQGQSPLRSFQLQTLTLAWFHVSFSNVPSLDPGAERRVDYSISGASGGEDADLLDVLMLATSANINPVQYPLRAQVRKTNGESRELRFKLTYSPMNNPRRGGSVSDVQLCAFIEPS